MALYATWLIRGRLLASSQPQSFDDLFEVRKMGVSVVLSFETHPDEREWCRELGLKFREVALEDSEAPSVQKIGEAVGFLHRYIVVQKRAAMMHCYAGLGRTGTVAACFIGALFGLNAEEAIRVVRSMRPGSIERNQEAAVREYLESFRRGEANREIACRCTLCSKPLLRPVATCVKCAGHKPDLAKLVYSFGSDGSLGIYNRAKGVSF